MDVTIHATESLKALGELITRLDDLKLKQKEVGKSTEEGRTLYAKYAAQIKALSAEKNRLTKQISNEIQKQILQKGSMDELSGSISTLQEAYKGLNAEERKSAQGSALRTKIKESTQELNALEEALRVNRQGGTDFDGVLKTLAEDIELLSDRLSSLVASGSTASEVFSQTTEEMSAAMERFKEYQDKIGDSTTLVTGIEALSESQRALKDVTEILNASQTVLNVEFAEASAIIEKISSAISGLNALLSICQVLEKSSNLNMSIRNGLLTVGVALQKKAIVSENAGTLSKMAGAIASKAAAAATFLFNKALAANPALLILGGITALVGGIQLLAKWFDKSADAEAAAAEASRKYETAQKEAEAVSNEVTRNFELNSQAKRQAAELEINAMRENGASEAEIGEKKKQLTKELRELDLQRIDDLMGPNQNLIEAKEKEIEAHKNLLKTHEEGSDEFLSEAEKLNELNIKLQELQATQTKLSQNKIQITIDTQNDRLSEVERNTEKEREIRSKLRDSDEQLALLRLEGQKKYHYDYTKSEEENAAARLAHEIAFETESLQIKQMYAQKRLKEQLNCGEISKREYLAQIKIMENEAALLQAQSAEKINEQRNQQAHAVLGSLKKSYQEQEKELLENQKQEREQLELAMGQRIFSEEEKEYYRLQLEQRQNQEMIGLAKQREDALVEMVNQSFEKQLKAAENHAEETIAIEIERQKALISTRKSAGLATTEEEAHLAQLVSKQTHIRLTRELESSELSNKEQYEKKVALLENEQKALDESSERWKEIEEEKTSLKKEYNLQQFENTMEYVQAASDIFGEVNSFMNALDDAELQKAEEKNEKKKASLDKQLAAGTISQKQYDKEVAKADEELDSKKKEIARKQAIRDKAASIFQIGIATATAIMKVFSDTSVLAAPILIPIIAATSALQLATVLATPLPKARRGGSIRGLSHEQGGVLIEAEGGESIINRKASAAFPELLSLMNAMGNRSNLLVSDGGFVARQTARSAREEYAFLSTASREKERSRELFSAEELGDILARKIGDLRIYTSTKELRDADVNYTKLENMTRL